MSKEMKAASHEFLCIGNMLGAGNLNRLHQFYRSGLHHAGEQGTVDLTGSALRTVGGRPIPSTATTARHHAEEAQDVNTRT